MGVKRKVLAALAPGKALYPLYWRPDGPQDVLDGYGKPRCHRDSIPGPSSPQWVAIPTTLWWTSFWNILWIESTPTTVLIKKEFGNQNSRVCS